jgi:LacI family transcriptional regulator
VTDAEPEIPVRSHPTIKDVAEVAGVAFKTVSRVLNDEPNVRPETRARVEAAIIKLNFQRNVAASSIRRLDRRTASIGLVVEDVANPFASRLARTVEDAASRRGHLVLVGSSDNQDEREQELVEQFLARRVDGLIVMPGVGNQAYLERARRRGIPVVFVDRPGRDMDADTVLSDNDGGTRTAVEHLGRAGHRRIAFLGDQLELYTAASRLDGYRAGLRALAGAVPGDNVRTGLHTSDRARQAAADLLTRGDPPTALVCGNNLICIGALHALQDLGARERVAIVGFDDVELADLLAPGVTVIAQDVAQIGRRAVDLLFARIGGTEASHQRIVVPVTLILRGSGEIRPHREGRDQ